MRTFKFYRKNEEEVMERLGLKPTINSGSGWIEKEDGQNDYVICQLKSTDKRSISLNQQDWDILEANALVAHKYPLFALQFLNRDQTFILMKPEDITEVAKYISSGRCEKQKEPLIEYTEQVVKSNKPAIKSSAKKRELAKKRMQKEREEASKQWKNKGI